MSLTQRFILYLSCTFHCWSAGSSCIVGLPTVHGRPRDPESSPLLAPMPGPCPSPSSRTLSVCLSVTSQLKAGSTTVHSHSYLYKTSRQIRSFANFAFSLAQKNKYYGSTQLLHLIRLDLVGLILNQKCLGKSCVVLPFFNLCSSFHSTFLLNKFYVHLWLSFQCTDNWTKHTT